MLWLLLALLAFLVLSGFVWLGWEQMQADEEARHEPQTLDVQNHIGDDVNDRINRMSRGYFG